MDTKERKQLVKQVTGQIVQKALSNGLVEEYAPGRYRLTEKGREAQSLQSKKPRRTPKLNAKFCGRAEDALTYITAYIAREGYGPTYREIAQELQIVHSYVHDIVHWLNKNGFIEMKSRQTRTMKVTGKSL